MLELERAGWEALSTSGEAASRFYADNLAASVLMLLPGGMIIDDRDGAIASVGGTPWSTFELSDERVLELSAQSAIVAYRATARRDQTVYTALVNSTYARENGAWRMVLHQQTPV